jgi:hypothetical protein
MRHTQLIALLLVVIMAVAVMPAMAAKEAKGAETPIVGASRWPTLSAYCTPPYPYRYQPYTVWGWLSWWGHPLSNRYVQVYYRFSTTAGWHYLKSVKTDVNGRYSFSSSSGAKYVYWMTKFAGDSVYYPKTAYKTVIVGLSKTSIAYKTYLDSIGIYGYVADGSGKKIVGAPVQLFHRSGSSTTWVYATTVYTQSGTYLYNFIPNWFVKHNEQFKA